MYFKIRYIIYWIIIIIFNYIIVVIMMNSCRFMAISCFINTSIQQYVPTQIRKIFWSGHYYSKMKILSSTIFLVVIANVLTDCNAVSTIIHIIILNLLLGTRYISIYIWAQYCIIHFYSNFIVKFQSIILY